MQNSCQNASYPKCEHAPPMSWTGRDPNTQSLVKIRQVLRNKGLKLAKKKTLPPRFRPDDLPLGQPEDQEKVAEASNENTLGETE